nr:reverse transcriptase domain-containing protein [Tanacetum cinerariifolium]
TPLPFINPKEDECVEETLTDLYLSEYTIKVPPPPVQRYKPPSQREYVVHQRDPLHPNIPYPSRMLKQKQKEKDEKKLGLPELISTRMTLELANRVICTPAGIARDVFVPVSKFTFPADFVIIDYENDPKVPLILGRPFLHTARTLIDVYEKEMILRDGDERLTLNMRHDTSSYSNKPKKESINMINICDNSNDVFNHDQVLKPLFPSPIPIEDSDSFLEKSDTSLSLPGYETFINHTEETNSGSTTTHADYSLPTGIFRILESPINGSSKIPKDPFKCFKVLFGRRCLIPRTPAYSKHQVGSAGSKVDSAELASLDDDASELDSATRLDVNMEIVMLKMMVNDLEKVHLDQWR